MYGNQQAAVGNLGSAIGVNTYPVDAPAPAGRVVEAMADQERLVLALHDEIGTLEARLTGVLRPAAPPTPQGNATGAAAQPSPLAINLMQGNEQLHRAVSRIRELIARSDV